MSALLFCCSVFINARLCPRQCFESEANLLGCYIVGFSFIFPSFFIESSVTFSKMSTSDCISMLNAFFEAFLLFIGADYSVNNTHWLLILALHSSYR